MHLTLSAVLAALPASKLHGLADAAMALRTISTDSRNIEPGALFVALVGERFDGHDYLAEVAERGVKVAVVSRYQPNIKITQIEVSDTLIALGDLGRFWRRQFDLPVIAVTGSNGKTTVKEMIAAILQQAVGEVASLATRGNLNNEIGVPLTVFRLRQGHSLAVLELGMNHPGEIARLASIAQPTVALVNNAQREHQEFMESVAAVAAENGTVIHALPIDGTAVFPADDEFTSYWREQAGQRQVMTFGLSNQATVWASDMHHDSAGQSHFMLHYGLHEATVVLNTLGEHNIRNALAAASCALAAGVSIDKVVSGLEAFTPVKGRLQRHLLGHSGHGRILIDDTYNANPDSVRAAIDVLVATPAPHCLILGDMGEVGENGPQFHQEIGAYAKVKGVEHFYCVGELAKYAAQAFGDTAHYFSDVENLNVALSESILLARSLLVKGSRFMRMERVVELLKKQYDDHSAVSE